MDASRHIERLVDHLAASWTDAVLDILKSAGLTQLTVERELQAWHALKSVLRSELRWQRAFRTSVLVSMNELMEQVLWKAALVVATTLGRQVASPEFATRVRALTAGWRATKVERRLFAEILRQPTSPAGFKSPLSTDFVPRLSRLSLAELA